MNDFNKIDYSSLNARQKETYNFQKVSALLADYGLATIKLNDDWQGADFIAQHIDGSRYLKVQLKSRLTLGRKYYGKDLYICFHHKGNWYLFPHDKVLNLFLETYSQTMALSKSWTLHGLYTYPSPSVKQLAMIAEYKL